MPNPDEKDKTTMYRYTIYVMLTVIGFLMGMQVQTERLRADIITNRVKVELIERQLVTINLKLDKLLSSE